MIGPGEYDRECSYVRASAPDALLVGVIVIGGRRGAGFSLQVAEQVIREPRYNQAIAAILRDLADKVEHDPPAQTGGRC